MDPRSYGRRALLAALGAWALAAAQPALAQDPQQSAARAATLAWLELADAGDGAATYNAASKRFREAIAMEQWTAALRSARERFGPLKRRTVMVVRPPEPGKDTPPGEFLVVVFRTEFGLRDMATETVTLEREADGTWRVVGYLMR
jgi:Protein of unknown function (DUF4019)